MSETMKVQSFGFLLKWILKEYEQNHSIFGIHRSQFHIPQPGRPYASRMFGSELGTPIGPAAGPATQLTQNIIASWLSGARFIELKTVQVMDQLEIPRPCIDMEDEGYNVEWSQELRLHESIQEYIKAWALLPILNRLLGWEDKAPLGTIFNMSVGYNLEGIQSKPMTQFMDLMVSAPDEFAQIQAYLGREYPQFADIDIPVSMTNNVTLSTMHGCPPDEIERIARYMLVERGMHTTVKMNPTLLGKERVLDILHNQLGYTDINIPDSVFEHDLKYERALELIRSLQATAEERGLEFGVKLSNTLAMTNHRSVMPGAEMYMSGRALYPLTMNLFNVLAHEFKGNLKVSYSAGADAVNTPLILSCGARPVTVASDLLKPGGYSRMVQYLENLDVEMRRQGATDLDAFAKDKLANLEFAAQDALENPRYKKSYFPYGLPKVRSGLGFFDCVVAPCVEPCAVHQDVPEYAWLISQGEYDRALEVILARNPMPGVTGYVCTHLCQTRCTRNDYEEPVAIRVLKRVAVERGQAALTVSQKQKTGHRAAVIGSGPSGLSAAAFLALNGVEVTVFEAKAKAGGMMRMIPAFRLPDEVIQEDIDRITALGVEIRTLHPIACPPEELLQEGFDAVYVAAGFQKDMPLEMEGSQGEGVYSALNLLERVRNGERPDLGRSAVIIGGGDTAMDAVRIAKRLTGQPATLLYRRTIKEMPASPEELEGAFEEGSILRELITPRRVILENGRVKAIECLRNRLGEPDASGRRRPVVIEGSEFVIETDAVITAIGQEPELGFLAGSAITRHKNGSIAADAFGRAGVARVYAGGDVVEGPDSIIAACADGRRAAEAICADLGIRFDQPAARPAELSEEEVLLVKKMRIRKEAQNKPPMMHPEARVDFALIEASMNAEMARMEAARCLQCTTFCDKCVEVCPNRANFTYMIEPVDWLLPRLVCQDGQLAESAKEAYRVSQTRQILHIDDFCNECGDCATFCVHHGKPYTEKPRLFFKREDYELEQDNAYHIEKVEQGWVMWGRKKQADSQLTLRTDTDEVWFENDRVRIGFKPAGFVVTCMELKQPFDGTLSLEDAAEMYVILKGLSTSMQYLPVL